LLIIERGAREARIEMVQRHPDVKDGRRLPTLLVQLAPDGTVSRLVLAPEATAPWTLRDGQHNSFPFVQPKTPLLAIEAADRDREEFKEKRAGDRRRAAIIDVLRTAKPNLSALGSSFGGKFFQRIRERRSQLESLVATPGEVVLASIDRFLMACDPNDGGDITRLVRGIVDQLCKNLKANPQDAWTEVAIALLVGKKGSGGRQNDCAGALVFDAAGDGSVLNSGVVEAVSDALRSAQNADSEASRIGVCGLTGGDPTALITSNFPQPNVAVLGQTYLFAKNRDAPANDRYGRFAADALPVGRDVAIRLAAAFQALTADDRRGITWRPIPSNVAKDSDLLLAFVHGVGDEQSMKVVMQEVDDLSEETPINAEDVEFNARRRYESRTRPVIEAPQAKRQLDETTQLDFVVFRKIDPANRKVIYSAATTIGALRIAVDRWIAGGKNVPAWVRLPLPGKKGSISPRSGPMLVSPLSLIDFSKAMFIRGGTQKQEVVGIPAAEAMALFLEDIPTAGCLAAQRVRRFLHMVLERRTGLLAGTAHALRRSFESLKEFDRREVLRTVTVLGILLEKLKGIIAHSSDREDDMESMAFQFGQLLAAVDVLHAGYCADVRKGDVPPALLGNQVFAIAQSSAKRAVEVLGQRLAPYLAWEVRTARDRGRIDGLANSKNPKEKERGWDIRKALRQARAIRPLATNLREFLPDPASRDEDLFRARLVLGYLAGIPPREDQSGEKDNDPTTAIPEEET
jgi:hypothetical protein